jgi:energy-converting hydrogenase B subunit D
VTQAVQAVALVVMAIVGTGVVLMRDPLRQALILGVYGIAMVVAFFVLQAPDVALSAIVISTVGLPPMVLLALRKIREYERDEER